MSSYERRRRAGRRRHEKRMAKKARGRSVGKTIALIIGILLILTLCVGIAYVATKWSKVQTEKISAKDLSINREVKHEKGYLNVALFGLDSRDADLGVGNRSDTIIVASLNKETGEIRLVSVYRDTLLELGDGSYNKCNAAYSFGDAEAATAMVNRNLDLDVKKYVACTWKALIDAVDAVGGLEINVAEDELSELNFHMKDTSQHTGVKAKPVKKAGLQVLNGIQATTYARIRKTDGGDFKRTERQREVLTKLFEKLRDCKPSQLNKIVDLVFPQVKTNFKLREVLSYTTKISHYAVSETMGFPVAVSGANFEGIGSCVMADNFASDVLTVHQFLFGQDTEYTPSEKVNSIGANIAAYKNSGSL